LSKGSDTEIVFLPFKPEVSYRISVLKPDYRPASLIAQSFEKILISELKRLGGVPVS